MKKQVYIYDFKINKTIFDEESKFTYMSTYTEVCNKTSAYHRILYFNINNLTKDHFVVIKKLVFYNRIVISIDIMKYTNFEFCKQANLYLSIDDPRVRKVYKKILRKFKRYNCNMLPYKIKINKYFIKGLTDDYL